MKMFKYLRKIKKQNTKWFRDDYKVFSELSKNINKGDFSLSNKYPCVGDKFAQSGSTSGAYFLQDIYVAREIYKANPQKHIDIASRIDGFVAHVAVFREIEIFDIRPLKVCDKNMGFRQANLMDLNNLYINYCDSISCLHSIEHFGLGRYGDPIDPNGHLKGIENIAKILKTNGIFYFSVPLGKNRVEFNAQRVFSLRYLLDWVMEKFKIIKFSYIDDDFMLHENVDITEETINNDCGCKCGCAIFTLQKK
ncbi:MAG: DUF268 domain-containing protein [Prevotellaceae bacterium]|jgi:SAM-dependent methyltransferase|nr:DUF268 domain-containing protein [Prevotellaceae bacterium]